MFIQVIVLYPGRWLFHKWKAKKKNVHIGTFWFNGKFFTNKLIKLYILLANTSSRG